MNLLTDKMPKSIHETNTPLNSACSSVCISTKLSRVKADGARWKFSKKCVFSETLGNKICAIAVTCHSRCRHCYTVQVKCKSLGLYRSKGSMCVRLHCRVSTRQEWTYTATKKVCAFLLISRPFLSLLPYLNINYSEHVGWSICRAFVFFHISSFSLSKNYRDFSYICGFFPSKGRDMFASNP